MILPSAMSLLPGLSQNASAAAAPTAAFNSTDDPATITAIENLLKGNDSGAALSNTEVVVRGGIWGDGALLHYVRSVDSSTNHYGIQYSTSYYCVNGKPQLNAGDSNEGTIKIEASIYAHLGDTYHDDPTIKFDAHVSHITFTPKQVPGQPLSPTKNISYDPAGRDNPDDSNNIKTTEGLHPGSGTGKIDVNGKNITDGCDITVADTSQSMPNLLASSTPQSVKNDWAATLTAAGGSNDTPGAPSTTDNSTLGGNKQLECDGSSSTLSWIICPVIDLFTNMINKLDNFITDQLTVKTDAIFCSSSDTCAAYYAAWQSFRNIALGLLVIAGLIMVISQTLGMEILDAYTIRKVLPRVLIVAIGITLSWSLMQFFVNLTNDLAFGIRHLIYQPFSGLRNEIDLSFGGSAAGIIGGFTALTLFSMMGLLSFLVTAGLAVLIAFVVLILRQVAITLLILIAPIAIIAYVLPNTQRVYKFWWDSFSKALLMFPLIAAFIASGRVFAAIALHNSSGSAGDASQIVGFAAYFAPYFLIPATFKFAGAAIGQIGGFVNDRGRGSFDRLRNFRNKRAATNWEKARAGSGNRWRDDYGVFKNPLTGKETSVSKIANRAANKLLDADEWVPHGLGKYGVPGFKRGRYVSEAGILAKKMDHNMKAFQELQQMGGMHYSTSRAVQGKMGYFQDKLDPATLNRLQGEFGGKNADGSWDGTWRKPRGTMDLIKMADILDESQDPQALLAAQEIKADAGKLGNLRGTDMHRADMSTIGLYSQASQGRTEVSDLTGAYNDMAGEGRANEGALVVATAQDLAKQLRPSQRRGYAVQFRRNKAGKMEAYSGYEDPNSDRAVESVMSMKVGDMQQAKGEDIDTIRDTILATASDTEMEYRNGVLVNTGRWKSADKLAKAKAMRQKVLQVGGQWSYTDAGAAQRMAAITEQIDFKPEELAAARGTMDPEVAHREGTQAAAEEDAANQNRGQQ